MMTENVEEALRNVLNIMEQAGFRIDQKVRVIVDKNLPFMGYTSTQWQSHVIVVSGFAVESPMLEGLLTHELSHAYRNITHHPSHSDPLIEVSCVSSSMVTSLTGITSRKYYIKP
jgi:Zn-dependent protease with chaperone function